MKQNRSIGQEAKISTALHTVLFIFLTLLLSPFSGTAQNKLAASGFAEYLNNTWAPESSAKWSNLSGVYNRLNLDWYPLNSLELHAGIRNNFSFGPLMAAFYPSYAEVLSKDYGAVDLTFQWAKDTSYLLYSNIDRLYAQWTFNKLELTVGRQRINWGLNFVWNPNDIFNTYNYFDFDYVERPGSDAVLLQYFTGDFSSLQIAAKVDNEKKMTIAAMYKFNVLQYDFQFLGGVMRDDVVAGLGWSGQIGGAGFTGEATYFRNKNNFADTTGQVVSSVSVNYTFSSGLYVNGSFIYNSAGTIGPAGLGSFFLTDHLSPKTLTRSKFDLFGQVSYPVTPLIKIDFSAIANPNDGSFFLGPSIDFSLTDNLDLMTMGQLFTGKKGTEFGDYGQMYYLRLKGSF